MNVLEHLRQWSTSDDEWAEMIEQREKYDLKVFVGAVDEASACAGRIAELLESYADRMERSGLVRAFASAFTPEGHRADAAVWRSGRNPWAEDAP